MAVRIDREALTDAQPVYVAPCLELDMACQGATVKEAKENLTDAARSFSRSLRLPRLSGGFLLPARATCL